MTEKTIERHSTNDNIEAHQAQSDNSIGQIAGYGIKFNLPSTSKGPFIEYVAPHAFDGVDMSNVLALYGHDYKNIIGRVDSGTLKLDVDDVGVHFVIDLPDTSIARDVYANIKAGNLKGMSLGFVVAKGGDEWRRDGKKPVRIIKKIERLTEISVVSMPAYDDTSVTVTRSLDAFLLEEKDKQYTDKVKVFLGGNHEEVR